jgi:sugar porter (SP) family MFS transporter
MIVTSLYQTTYYFGAVVAAWTTFGTFSMTSTWAWRIPSLVQAAPAIVTAFGVWSLPESPRWLVSKGRKEEARAVLVKFHGNGDENDEFTQLEFEEITITIEGETSRAEQSSWKSLFQTPGNRHRVFLLLCIGLFSQLSGNGLVSYYLSTVLDTVGITNTRSQNILNGCLSIFNWITSIISAFLIRYLKRRTQWLVSICGILVCFSLQTLGTGLFNQNGNKEAGNMVIAMLFLFYTFYNLGFNALLYSYPVEILPFHIRAKGMSVLMLTGKSAAFLNEFVNPIGMDSLGWKYYFVYIGWLCFEAIIVYCFFVETRGPTLEAIKERFDGLKDDDVEDSSIIVQSSTASERLDAGHQDQRSQKD